MTDTPSHPPVRLLGFAGSLRQGSYNRALLRAAQELAPDGMTIEIFDISDIPLYNGDVEAKGDPESVTAFKQAIREADGLLIATPEYNHGVPGVTKNAVDWASRPPGRSALAGKPVGVMGATPGNWGTARSQHQLRQAFVFTNCHPLQQPEVLVAQAQAKFDDQGRLTDETTQKVLATYLAALRQWVLIVKAGKAAVL